MSRRIAIIDLGTNTFHLLIAETSGGKTQILFRKKVGVKLGLQGINRGVITEEAIGRGIACLKNFKRILSEWNITDVRALGTSALRSAGNQKEVVDRIKNETGIDVTVISGDQEAEYIYYGIRLALPLGSEKSVIMDIGGGSVEFIIANAERIFWKKSFDLGAQRLLEQFQKHDPIHSEEIKQLEAHFDRNLEPLYAAMKEHAPKILVGSSGTFDTLSEIHCTRRNIIYDSNAGETPLTSSDYLEIHEELLSKNREERLHIPGMIVLRVDMIVVASCLIKHLYDRYTFEKIRVSTYSLKEGAFVSV